MQPSQPVSATSLRTDALARTLWDPAGANRSEIMDEYYSGYGGGGPAMRAYYGYWRSFVQQAYTDPAVLARIAEYEDQKSARYLGLDRAQYIMAGEIYTTEALEQASALLAKAEARCDSMPACARVNKTRLHLRYVGTMAAAANATEPTNGGVLRRPVSHHTEPAEAMVTAGQALLAAAKSISGQHIVNTWYELGKANERGDLLGLLASEDGPAAASPHKPAYMLSPLFWFMALDPTDAGVREQWFLPSVPHTTAWNRTAVGCGRINWCGICGSAAMRGWEQGHGAPYQGVSWWAVRDPCDTNGCTPLLGDNSTRALYLQDGGNASSITVYFDGAELGGCSTAAECGQELVLPLPSPGKRPAAGKSALVVRVNTSSTGKLKRFFVLR